MKQFLKISLIILGIVSIPIFYGVVRYFLYDQYKEVEIGIKPTSYDFIADGKALVVSWENERQVKEGESVSSVLQGKRYLSTESYKLAHYPDRYLGSQLDVNKLSWGEYWRIKVYDLSKQNLSIYKEYPRC